MNNRPLKTRSDFMIAIIVSLIIGMIIGHYQIPGFLVSLFQAESGKQENAKQIGLKPIGSALKTYYQWFDINGKMRISQFKPQDVADYITFEGSRDLRDVSYEIDQKMLANGLAYRDKLLSGGDSRAETDSFLGNLLSSKNTASLDKNEQCAGLTGWLADISQTIARDESMKRPFCEKYRARLQELQRIGCRSTLKSFEAFRMEHAQKGVKSIDDIAPQGNFTESGYDIKELTSPKTVKKG